MKLLMIQFSVPEVHVAELRSLSVNHPHPRVRIKALAVVMKSEGLLHKQIQSTLDITGNTLRTYFSEYLNGGPAALEILNFYQPSGRLADHKISLTHHFSVNPPSSIKHAMATIRELTGIDVGRTQTRTFLKSIGLKRRLVGTVPARADVDVQKEFLENELEPRLQEARAGARTVFFVDAAHFVFSIFLGYLWCISRVFVKSLPGRQRLNVLGALDAVTHEMLTIVNTTYINAQSVCELLQKIAAQKLIGPITIVLDNARYQRCELVTNLAKELDIELLFLPPYSPNLNLIERTWKFVKKNCLATRFYPDFASFSQAIETFIETMDSKYSNELETLLSHKFQSFEKIQKAA